MVLSQRDITPPRSLAPLARLIPEMHDAHIKTEENVLTRIHPLHPIWECFVRD